MPHLQVQDTDIRLYSVGCKADKQLAWRRSGKCCDVRKGELTYSEAGGKGSDHLAHWLVTENRLLASELQLTVTSLWVTWAFLSLGWFFIAS